MFFLPRGNKSHGLLNHPSVSPFFIVNKHTEQLNLSQLNRISLTRTRCLFVCSYVCIPDCPLCEILAVIARGYYYPTYQSSCRCTLYVFTDRDVTEISLPDLTSVSSLCIHSTCLRVVMWWRCRFPTLPEWHCACLRMVAWWRYRGYPPGLTRVTLYVFTDHDVTEISLPNLTRVTLYVFTDHDVTEISLPNRTTVTPYVFTNDGVTDQYNYHRCPTLPEFLCIRCTCLRIGTDVTGISLPNLTRVPACVYCVHGVDWLWCEGGLPILPGQPDNLRLFFEFRIIYVRGN